MKKYLKYLGYGFLTLFLYYTINLLMALLTLIFDSAFHNEIYGDWEPRKPYVAIAFFAIICVLYILILLGFFFFGRAFKFRKEKMLLAFILFIIPNIALQMLIYSFNSMELMFLLNWFLSPLGNAFFFDTSTNYYLCFSFFWNSLLTYFPFILAFLGGLSKMKKNQNKIEGTNT